MLVFSFFLQDINIRKYKRNKNDLFEVRGHLAIKCSMSIICSLRIIGVTP